MFENTTPILEEQGPSDSLRNVVTNVKMLMDANHLLHSGKANFPPEVQQ